jgi:hypothetical protein
VVGRFSEQINKKLLFLHLVGVPYFTLPTSQKLFFLKFQSSCLNLIVIQQWHSWEGGVEEWCACPGQQSRRGEKLDG